MACEGHSEPRVREDDIWLKAQDLHTYYGQSHVLQGVDLTLRSGETVGLLGRNGMGKTTLIRSLLGLVPIRSGEIWIQSHRMTGSPTEKIVQTGIGYVPEGRGVFANLTVQENLMMAAKLPSVQKSMHRVWTLDVVLDLFPRLRERLNHAGGQLSGGEQQMVAIARALMLNPELLILDEATEGLAPPMVKETWTVLEQVRQTGIAILIVDRDYRKVLAYASQCVVLEKGRVVLNQSAAEISQTPATLERYLGL